MGNTKMIKWIVAGIPLLVILLIITFNNIFIFVFVYKTIHRGRRNSQSIFNPVSENEKKRIRMVATQSFLYIASFMLSYGWLYILNVLQTLGYDNQKELYIILLFASIFYPLQGFSNTFVYIRPKYIRYRQRYNEHTRFWAFQQVLFENYNNGEKYCCFSRNNC